MTPQKTNLRDPICGMQGSLERHGRWFCSEACVAEYEHRQADHAPRRRWAALDAWIWVPATGLVMLSLGLWWPGAATISAIYRGYVGKVLVPFLIGVALGGFIDHFVPREYVVRLLSGSRKRVIARATLLGFLASTCSHGCLALSIELYRKGAAIPAVVSFLLASPWASMSLTFILLSLFGPLGLLFIAGALGIAYATGLIFQRLASAGRIETNPNAVVLESGYSIRRDFGARWRKYPWTLDQLSRDARGVLAGMVPLGRMMLGWVQLGLILSALLGGLVPHGLIDRFLGPTPAGLTLTLFAAAVIEVCSEGTAPLAYEIYRHTGALGNAFAFLMGGVVTDYTELIVLWRNIGRRTVLWMLVVTLPMVMLLGLVLNWIAAR